MVNSCCIKIHSSLCCSHNHLLTYDFTVLSKDSNNFHLLIKKGLLIARDKLIFNKTVKSLPLDLFEGTEFDCCITF